jgi:hypothetical protein
MGMGGNSRKVHFRGVEVVVLICLLGHRFERRFWLILISSPDLFVAGGSGKLPVISVIITRILLVKLLTIAAQPELTVVCWWRRLEPGVLVLDRVLYPPFS